MTGMPDPSCAAPVPAPGAVSADAAAKADRIIAAMREKGIPVLPSHTNFLFVRADPEDATHVQQALRERGILVRHFTADRLNPYLRVTIGTEEEMETVTRALIELCRV